MGIVTTESNERYYISTLDSHDVVDRLCLMTTLQMDTNNDAAKAMNALNNAHDSKVVISVECAHTAMDKLREAQSQEFLKLGNPDTNDMHLANARALEDYALEISTALLKSK